MLSAEDHLFSLYRVSWFAVRFMLLLQDCFQLTQLSELHCSCQGKNTLTVGCIQALLL